MPVTDKYCTKLQELVETAVIDSTMPQYPINEQMVLAGQPEPEDWQRLAERGFTLIINIRSDAARAAAQQKSAEAAGLRYIHLPLPAYELEPIHIQQLHHVLMEARHDNVLFHCRTASRSGLLWLLHRIEYDGWSQEEAEAELQAAGFDGDSMEVFDFCSEDYFERAEGVEAYA